MELRNPASELVIRLDGPNLREHDLQLRAQLKKMLYRWLTLQGDRLGSERRMFVVKLSKPTQSRKVVTRRNFRDWANVRKELRLTVSTLSQEQK